MAKLDDGIAAVRRFNRFYTKHLGVLQEDWLSSAFSLTEARVLYELARRNPLTATAIGDSLGLDAGYLSRLLRRFEKQSLIDRRPAPNYARQSLISITAKGRKAFQPLDQLSQDQAGGALSKLSAIDQRRLVAAMGTIENLLHAAPDGERHYTLREPRYGDFGWIVSRHGELYFQEYGWTAPFEGLCAGIVGDYINKL
ncbi:MAG: winged helix-turn-helix transcriptional regulator, partial [Pseudolabrys sp.]|nr:winged helix-turn-helix transcriptional regulator [Pseudolabrys sp.]